MGSICGAVSPVFSHCYGVGSGEGRRRRIKRRETNMRTRGRRHEMLERRKERILGNAKTEEEMGSRKEKEIIDWYRRGRNWERGERRNGQVGKTKNIETEIRRQKEKRRH